METQWPLVIFTLFVCLTCGTLGGMSILALTPGQEPADDRAHHVRRLAGGRRHRSLPAPRALGAHLQRLRAHHVGHHSRSHRMRGAGHRHRRMVRAALRGGKPVPKALAWATSRLPCVLMMVATAHSYLMPARPAPGARGVLSGNACLPGAAAVWLISILKKDEAVEATGIQLTFIAFPRADRGRRGVRHRLRHGEDRAIRLLRRPDIDDHYHARRQPDDRHGVRRAERPCSGAPSSP